LPLIRAAELRARSSAAVFRFCGIMMDPYVKPSPNSTKPNSLEP
jgi:hypothetical protein